jgi:hypothetical protein
MHCDPVRVTWGLGKINVEGFPKTVRACRNCAVDWKVVLRARSETRQGLLWWIYLLMNVGKPGYTNFSYGCPETIEPIVANLIFHLGGIEAYR